MLHRRSPFTFNATFTSTSTSTFTSTATAARLLTSLASVGFFIGILVAAQPSFAAWEGSAAEEVTAKVVDAVIVRPLAAVRVAVGAALFVPSSLLASPSGREGISTAYDVLIAAPMEYAFERELGDF